MIAVINPANETICGQYACMNQNDVEQIIQEMHVAQKKWAKSSIALRKQCLLNLAQIILEYKETAATLMTNEMGKPITQAVAEIEKCASLCDYYATMGEAFLKAEQIQTEFYKSYRSFQAMGIIFAIMPWNYPFWQVLRFAVPNLMVGNAGLLKHAPNSTGTALLIEKLILKAGFPSGLFRSLVIDVDLAPFVIQHPRIQGVTLTGSNQAGKSVAQTAGAALKKVVLELGGSDPYIILADADLAFAAQQCAESRLSNAGQICIAAKRIIVVESVAQKFTELLIEQTKHYVIGNPLDETTTLGPMAREDLRLKVHEQVQRSIQMGARCVLGGTMPSGKGYYYPATILLDITIDSPAFNEELFGPVICIIHAKDEQDAIRLANTSTFGLAGAVFTRDLKKGELIARDLIEAGTCAVNSFVKSDPRLPFGGIKQSGYGRELALEGMREFVNIKTVTISGNDHRTS